MPQIMIPASWVAVCTLLAFFIGMLGGVSMMIRNTYNGFSNRMPPR